MAHHNRPAAWFWLAAVILLLWGMIGVFAFYSDVTMNDQAKAQLSDYDRTLLASRPSWFLWLYGVATWSALLGAVALLARSRLARPIFIVSLIAVIVQFGYIFANTDLIAVKGFVAAAGFPILIVIIAACQIWLAGHAQSRGWIG
jgi:hypothetical protein